MARTAQTRRRFIFTLIAFIAGLMSIGKFLRPRFSARKPLITVAKDDIPARGALVYRDSRVAVIRDGESLYALDLVCTHLGCTVTVTATEMICPCHGSRFDLQGRVVKGPADRPLARYKIEERDGKIIVLT